MDDLIEFKGVLVRRDRSDDRLMVNECEEAYRFFKFGIDDTVLDLGVNVGGFARMALRQKIDRYIGVEPDPENFEVAEKNLARLNPFDVDITLLVGAASASTAETLTFAQSPSGYGKCSGTVALNSRNSFKRTIRYTVKNYNLDELICRYCPSIVKMDIEGAEFDWFEKNRGLLSPCIEQFAVDLHGIAGVKRFDEELLPNMLKHYELVSVVPNTAYENSGLQFSLKNFKVRGRGRLRALDAFFIRRR